MTRALGLLLVLFALPSLAKPPRLTLLISVDSLSSDLLQRSRPRLKGGLAQLMNTGAFFPVARYEYAKTRTAPGHSTLATGANPWRHGIVDNRLFNRATGQRYTPFSDPAHPFLDAPNVPGDVSPLNLLAETVGDRLRVATQERGKVVALSGKARAAIPFAGRLGQAFWFEEDVGKWITGTWYAKALPPWLQRFNEQKVHEAYFAKGWPLLRPAAEYLGEDDRSFESADYGLGRTFPHPLSAGLSAPGPQSHEAFSVSPYFNDVLVQAAKAAIEGEQLGKDEVPDLLGVSFSATDRIFHMYGPYSWESQDAILRLDAAIGELVAAAERAAGGKNQLLVVLSADHGGAAIPEEWAALGLPAQRFNPETLQKGLTQEIQSKFGKQVQVLIEELDIYLYGKAFADPKFDGAAVRRAAAAWLSQQPHIALAVSKDDLYQTPDVAGVVTALRKGYYPERSGDVFYVTKPFVVVDDYPTGTNHGTPYAYDNQVPVIFAGKGIRAGNYQEQISPTDVVPTACAVMEIGLPASAEGKPRFEALLR